VSTCVIFNPRARGEKAQLFRSRLNQFGDRASFVATSGPGSATELAKEAVTRGFETIVAAGGDGTLNEVLNGMAEAENGFQRSRLSVLPLGTINVFAREIKMPSKLEEAWSIVMRGREALVDVGEATFQCRGASQKRYFLQLAGAGWDARAVELTNWELKKKIWRKPRSHYHQRG
jgi:diacylglycerol kinase (ATP)